MSDRLVVGLWAAATWGTWSAPSLVCAQRGGSRYMNNTSDVMSSAPWPVVLTVLGVMIAAAVVLVLVASKRSERVRSRAERRAQRSPPPG